MTAVYDNPAIVIIDKEMFEKVKEFKDASRTKQ